MNDNSNQLNPVSATKEMIEVKPIMELFNKYNDIDLRCSIDSNDDAVPKGARDYFNRYGYLIIQNLFNPEELFDEVPVQRGQITYYGSLEKYSYSEEELQVNGSLSRYNHPRYKEAHSKIRLILEDILGQKLYNTYYYDRFYFSGQKLCRHIDRDACEISVSIQVSTNSTNSWPFCIETHNGEERFCNLQNGWGILYKGCEREHWRDSLQSRHNKLKKLTNNILKKKDDTYHHQIFFHYVLSDGERSHFAWDVCG
jgi:hypothetical protein